MRKIVAAVTAAVIGATAYTAVAQPTLDFSPNKVWRNAPESTALEQRSEETGRFIQSYTQEQPFVFNP